MEAVSTQDMEALYRAVSFRPLLTDAGAIMWTCGRATRTENPDTEIGPNLTDVKPQFLPAECR